jgi:sulfite exporter TauE/SafE
LLGHLHDHHLMQLSGWSWLLPASIFTASLLGSAHCAGMCGGLLAATAQSKAERIYFHLGRGVAYVALGFLAGALGHGISGDSSPAWLAVTATVMYSLTLVFLGVRALVPGRMHLALPAWLERVTVDLFRLIRAGGKKPWARLAGGAMIPLLPCGWLYMFVLGAASSGSGFHGAILLFSFWAGTLPALEATNFGIKKFSGVVARRAPRMAGILLVTAGVVSLVIKFI